MNFTFRNNFRFYKNDIATLFLFLIIFNTVIVAKAQLRIRDKVTTESDSILITNIINGKLSTSQYTRIPNKDLDQILENRINNKIDSELSKLYTAFFTILAVLAGGGYLLFKTAIESGVASSVKSAETDLQKTLTERYLILEQGQKQIEKNITENYKSDIKNMQIDFLSYKNSFDDFKNSADELDRRQRKYLVEVRLDKLSRDFNLRDTYDLEENFEDQLNDVYAEALEVNDKSFIVKSLNLLISYLYNDNKTTELERIIEESKFPEYISNNSYTNYVLVKFNRYQHNPNDVHKEDFFRSINTTTRFRLEKGYGGGGVITALRLELLIKELKVSSIDKEIVKQKIIDVFNEVFSGFNNVLNYEVFQRIKLDLNSPFKVIQDLNKYFPSEMKQIEDRAKEYLIDNYLSTSHIFYKNGLKTYFPDVNIDLLKYKYDEQQESTDNNFDSIKNENKV